MDTKLKSYKMGSPKWFLNGLLWVVMVLSGTAIGGLAATAAALSDLWNITEKNWALPENESVFYDSYWGVHMKSEEAVVDFTANLLLYISIAGVLFLGAVISLILMTGTFNREEDGRIRLVWFDKIWSEVQLIALTLAVVGAVALAVPIYKIIPAENWFDLYRPGFENVRVFGISNHIVLRYAMLAMATLIFLSGLFGISMIKKLKAKSFWKNSFIGWVGTSLAREIDKITKMAKSEKKSIFVYMAILICMVVLAMSWIGAIVDLAIIILYVPKKVGKFMEIKDGVEEVKNGNLSYKIKVDMGPDGPKSDLDSLAQDINDISQSTNIAIQNELKNQRMKTDLISNVSHDLKTPLTSMITYLDLLKTEGLKGEHAEDYLDIIDEKTQRLKALTEDLFEAAKASSGNIPVNMEEIDLEAMIKQSLAELEERLENRKLQVILKIETETNKIKADGKLLWRVLENLLGNVIKYALPESRVYINVTQPAGKRKDFTLIEIKNISKEQLNISTSELMERFKRGDESRNTEGSGLGLSIAKDLTKIMDGIFEISVDGDLFKASLLLETAGLNEEKDEEKSQN